MAKTNSKLKVEAAPELDSAEEIVAEAKPAKTRRARITKTAEKIAEEISDAISTEPEKVDDSDFGSDEEEPVQKGRNRSKDGKESAPFQLEDLDKANVWGLNEQELFDIYIEGRRQESFSENEVHYMNLIRPVFEFQFFDINNRELHDTYKEQGFYIFSIPSNSSSNALAIRRRPIKKITDITLENIFHIPPTELLRLIDENMGTGWQGLPLYLQDIILAGFYVDCSVLPEFAMHKAGGIIDRRKADGYDVLEIVRGSWIEAVFVKVKPKQEKLHFEAISDKPVKKKRETGDDDDEEYDDDDEELDDEDDELDDAEDEEPEENEEPEYEDIDMIDPDSDE